MSSGKISEETKNLALDVVQNHLHERDSGGGKERKLKNPDVPNTV